MTPKCPDCRRDQDECTCHESKSMQRTIDCQAAQIERLHSALCEIAGSKSLTATPTQFYQHLQRVASDALNRLQEACNGEDDNEFYAANSAATKYLSAPSDTSALEAMIAKAGEKMREKCANLCDDSAKSLSACPKSAQNDAAISAIENKATRIRTLPGVTLEDLK